MIAPPTGITIVDTVVEFHRLVPVVLTRCSIKLVIACTLCRILHIRLFTFCRSHGTDEGSPRTIIKVVLWIEVLACIVVGTKISHAFRQIDAMIFARYMVRHKVNDDLHSGQMRTINKLLKLHHSVRHIDGYIRINVVIIRDGIRRACLTLDYTRMLARNAILRVVGCCSMPDNTRIPHMRKTHIVDLTQAHYIEIVHLPHSILGKRTILLASRITIAEKTSEDLIYQYFSIHPVMLFRERKQPCQYDESFPGEPCQDHTL